MTPFDLGNGTQTHQSVIGGLDTNPNVVNQVYVRCASHPDYLMSLKYRVRANVNPSYPRTGNLWGWSQWIGKGLPYHVARRSLAGRRSHTRSST